MGFSFSYSQSKTDLIVKNDEKIIQVNILKVGTSEITFTYAGEKVENILSKTDIMKIIFANGREEVFTKNEKQSESISTHKKTKTFPLIESVQKNVVSICPILFIENGQCIN